MGSVAQRQPRLSGFKAQHTYDPQFKANNELQGMSSSNSHLLCPLMAVDRLECLTQPTHGTTRGQQSKDYPVPVLFLKNHKNLISIKVESSRTEVPKDKFRVSRLPNLFACSY